MAKFGTTSTGNNSNWSHTVDAGNNLALIICFGTHQGNVTTVTWNSVSLTQVSVGHSTSNENGEIWALLSPTPAIGTVAVTTDGGSWWGGVAVNVSGVKQNPLASWIQNSGGGSSSSATIALTPPSSNCLMISAMGAEANATSVSDTLIANLQGASFENESSQYLLGSAAHTFTFTLSSGQRWGVAAIAIEDAPYMTLDQYLRQGFS